jgi:hypothetical protein
MGNPALKTPQVQIPEAPAIYVHETRAKSFDTLYVQQQRPGVQIGMVTALGVPFEEFPLVAPAHGASPDVVSVDRHAPASGEKTTFAVYLNGPGAKRRVLATIPYTPIPLSKEMIDAAWGEGATKRRQYLESAMHYPAFVPPVSQLFTGRDGSIWLRREEGGKTLTWWILDRAGKIVGTVELPADTKIFDADSQHLWTAEVDDDQGATYVVRYRLERP